MCFQKILKKYFFYIGKKSLKKNLFFVSKKKKNSLRSPKNQTTLKLENKTNNSLGKLREKKND